MQGKPSSPLCQVWVHVSLRVAKQQMGGIPAWMHLLSKWKQRYGIGHTENKGEKRNNKNGKIWNMQFSKWEKSSVKKESPALLICYIDMLVGWRKKGDIAKTKERKQNWWILEKVISFAEGKYNLFLWPEGKEDKGFCTSVLCLRNSLLRVL